ncbi:hypothetical protein [Streptomyces oceani]|uniref:hypothetical protein n=1 Tax=Streptomyces oceani TaxID=1075402 RepID=UPI0014803DA8|nr:hypothetical protein [Streptomyces oceani]
MAPGPRAPVVVVTGGSSVVGRATVRELAVGLAVSADVADHEAIRRAAERIEGRG